MMKKKSNISIMMISSCCNCEAEMTESTLEALHRAVVNKSMGEEERHINLSLTWPGLHHPNANGSYGHRMRSQSQINTSSVSAITYLQISAIDYSFFPSRLHAYVSYLLLTR